MALAFLRASRCDNSFVVRPSNFPTPAFATKDAIANMNQAQKYQSGTVKPAYTRVQEIVFDKHD
jgi:hypothetical protein